MANLTQMERLSVTPEYLAGCIDCDGCISIVNMKRSARGLARRYELRVKITNTNKEFLEAIQATYGGGLKHMRHKTENWKDLYDWEVSGAKAEEILIATYPHLILKQPRAAVALEMRSTFKESRERVSEEALAIREACFQKLKVLNMKGVTV